MVRICCLIPLLALVGCAGSVAVEDLDPFGGAASAVWFHWDDSDYDSIVLSNVVGLCGKWTAYVETAEELEDAAEDLDVFDNDYCEEAMEPMFRHARAAEALFHDGAHYLELGVREGDRSEPDEDTYEVDGDKRSLSGTVSYLGESAWSNILAEWDPEEDFEDGCGLSASDLESDIDLWYLDEGELEIGQVADERVVGGRLEGELADSDGSDEGEIKASFSASWCEIDR